MLRVALILALSILAGCDLVGLGSDPTVVSGVVLEDGEPVPGVEVALLGGNGPSPFLSRPRVYATDITDSRGFYSISADWDDDDDWTECGFSAVNVEADTKTALRLTAFDAHTEISVDCGSHNVRNFQFTTRLWYLGVDLYGPAQANGGRVLRDTVEIESGSFVNLYGTFVRSLTPAENAVHRDSSDWVWNGAPQWRWEVTSADSARYVDRTWDSCYTCTRSLWPDYMHLEVLGVGRINAVLRIPGTPFADSVLIVVRRRTSP